MQNNKVFQNCHMGSFLKVHATFPYEWLQIWSQVSGIYECGILCWAEESSRVWHDVVGTGMAQQHRGCAWLPSRGWDGAPCGWLLKSCVLWASDFLKQFEILPPLFDYKQKITCLSIPQSILWFFFFLLLTPQISGLTQYLSQHLHSGDILQAHQCPWKHELVVLLWSLGPWPCLHGTGCSTVLPSLELLSCKLECPADQFLSFPYIPLLIV